MSRPPSKRQRAIEGAFAAADSIARPASRELMTSMNMLGVRKSGASKDQQPTDQSKQTRNTSPTASSDSQPKITTSSVSRPSSRPGSKSGAGKDQSVTTSGGVSIGSKRKRPQTIDRSETDTSSRHRVSSSLRTKGKTPSDSILSAPPDICTILPPSLSPQTPKLLRYLTSFSFDPSLVTPIFSEPTSAPSTCSSTSSSSSSISSTDTTNSNTPSVPSSPRSSLWSRVPCGYRVRIPLGQSITLLGACRISVISGAVQVGGLTLSGPPASTSPHPLYCYIGETPATSPVDVFSPGWSPAILHRLIAISPPDSLSALTSPTSSLLSTSSPIPNASPPYAEVALLQARTNIEAGAFDSRCPSDFYHFSHRRLNSLHPQTSPHTPTTLSSSTTSPSNISSFVPYASSDANVMTNLSNPSSNSNPMFPPHDSPFSLCSTTLSYPLPPSPTLPPLEILQSLLYREMIDLTHRLTLVTHSVYASFKLTSSNRIPGSTTTSSSPPPLDLLKSLHTQAKALVPLHLWYQADDHLDSLLPHIQNNTSFLPPPLQTETVSFTDDILPIIRHNLDICARIYLSLILRTLHTLRTTQISSYKHCPLVSSPLPGLTILLLSRVCVANDYAIANTNVRLTRPLHAGFYQQVSPASLASSFAPFSSSLSSFSPPILPHPSTLWPQPTANPTSPSSPSLPLTHSSPYQSLHTTCVPSLINPLDPSSNPSDSFSLTSLPTNAIKAFSCLNCGPAWQSAINIITHASTLSSSPPQQQDQSSSLPSAPPSLPALSQQQGVRVMIIGPRNSGKSSFTRMLANALLSLQQSSFSSATSTPSSPDPLSTHARYPLHPVVSLLETDVGQSETSPSGMISLTALTRLSPHLGTPPSHTSWSPDASIPFGSNSPGSDPRGFIAAARLLFERWCNAVHTGQEQALTHLSKEDDANPSAPQVNLSMAPPLLINTPGWTTGLGRSLLIQLADVIRPTHIVSIEAGPISVTSSQYLDWINSMTRVPSFPSASSSSSSSSASSTSLLLTGPSYHLSCLNWLLSDLFTPPLTLLTSSSPSSPHEVKTAGSSSIGNAPSSTPINRETGDISDEDDGLSATLQDLQRRSDILCNEFSSPAPSTSSSPSPPPVSPSPSGVREGSRIGPFTPDQYSPTILLLPKWSLDKSISLLQPPRSMVSHTHHIFPEEPSFLAEILPTEHHQPKHLRYIHSLQSLSSSSTRLQSSPRPSPSLVSSLEGSLTALTLDPSFDTWSVGLDPDTNPSHNTMSSSSQYSSYSSRDRPSNAYTVMRNPSIEGMKWYSDSSSSLTHSSVEVTSRSVGMLRHTHASNGAHKAIMHIVESLLKDSSIWSSLTKTDDLETSSAGSSFAEALFAVVPTTEYNHDEAVLPDSGIPMEEKDQDIGGGQDGDRVDKDESKTMTSIETESKTCMETMVDRDTENRNSEDVLLSVSVEDDSVNINIVFDNDSLVASSQTPTPSIYAEADTTTLTQDIGEEGMVDTYLMTIDEHGNGNDENEKDGDQVVNGTFAIASSPSLPTEATALPLLSTSPVPSTPALLAQSINRSSSISSSLFPFSDLMKCDTLPEAITITISSSSSSARASPSLSEDNTSTRSFKITDLSRPTRTEATINVSITVEVAPWLSPATFVSPQAASLRQAATAVYIAGSGRVGFSFRPLTLASSAFTLSRALTHSPSTTSSSSSSTSLENVYTGYLREALTLSSFFDNTHHSTTLTDSPPIAPCPPLPGYLTLSSTPLFIAAHPSISAHLDRLNFITSSELISLVTSSTDTYPLSQALRPLDLITANRLIGTIVALVYLPNPCLPTGPFPPSSTSSSSSSHSPTSPMMCLGLAILRSVDNIQQHIDVVTPCTHLVDRANVICELTSSVAVLPPQFKYVPGSTLPQSGIGVASEKPKTAGASAMKSRHNIVRGGGGGGGASGNAN